MAGKNWFLTATTLAGSRALAELAQTAATLPDGWAIGKTGTVNLHSVYYAGVKRPAGSFLGTSAPDGSVDLTNHDAFIAGPYSGVFTGGTWNFYFVFRPTTAGNQRVAIYLRLARGTDPTGAGATEITSAQQAGTTTAALAATSTDYTSQVTFNVPGLTLTNEYLFFQLGLRRVALGSKPNADAVFRTGSSASVGTRILSADWTPNPIAATAAEGAATAVDAPSARLTQPASVPEGSATATELSGAFVMTSRLVMEGGDTANDLSDAVLVPGTPRIGRVAWIRMIAPREASTAASVIEGGPTAQDECDAKFAIAATIAEAGNAQDTVTGAAAYACEVREGSPIAVDSIESSANIVTHATIAEVSTSHDDVFSQFDPATAFMREGAETALDLCEATVTQPSAVAEGSATALDTCSTSRVLPVDVFEGTQTAQDAVSCTLAFDVSVAEGAPSAADTVSVVGVVLAPASVAEGSPTAGDSQDATVLRNAFIEEGDDTAIDAIVAALETGASVEEGADTAADEPDAATGWFVRVDEGGDTAQDSIVCELGAKHVERERVFLQAPSARTYLEALAHARVTLALARAAVVDAPSVTRKVDETTREVEVVGGDAPTRLYDK